MKTEKPQTLHFDLNNNPKYDTGLVCGGTLEVFVEPILAVSTLYILAQGTWPGAFIKSRVWPALMWW